MSAVDRTHFFEGGSFFGEPISLIDIFLTQIHWENGSKESATDWKQKGEGA
jgi:hypothetical protein